MLNRAPEKPPTTSCCQGKVSTQKMLPFYYTFIQFISLLYSLNFILRGRNFYEISHPPGFFSYVGFINEVIVPLLFCIMEFAQIYVIGIMFIKEMNKKSKGIVAMIAIFVALVDVGMRVLRHFFVFSLLSLCWKNKELMFSIFLARKTFHCIGFVMRVCIRLCIV
jgi:magnesium-transporting ATPase (P-type)